MGYRSDVALAMKEEKFKDFLSSVKDDKTAVELLSGCDKYEKDGWILLFYNSVKWYDDYKEVKAINEFVDTLDADDYSYHIMGEDSEDYTQKGTWESPFEIRLSRSLEFFT
jgi:uncharacterized protein YaaR (DUF327 family)